MRIIGLALVATALLASAAHAGDVLAVVHKAGADIYAEPRLDAPKVTAALRGTTVTVSGQQGLWYRVQLPTGVGGFVRVHDVRGGYAGPAGGGAGTACSVRPASEASCASTTCGSATPARRVATRACAPCSAASRARVA